MLSRPAWVEMILAGQRNLVESNTDAMNAFQFSAREMGVK
jgi:hypothetical protein